MSRFRHLLSPKTALEWADELEETFVASKEKSNELIQKGVSSFDLMLETCLSIDYSKEGMGWILQQKPCGCKKISPTCCPNGCKLVLAGGAFCRLAERNYSPIEGEATAIFKGLQVTKYYTLGCKSLHVATDHQPLVTTLGKQSVAGVPNKRLARIKEKIMCWKFNMIYNPGKMKSTADAISRCKPLHMMYISASQQQASSGNDDDKEILEVDLEAVQIAIDSVSSDAKIIMMSWNRVHRATQEDGTLLRLMKNIQRGMPEYGLELDKDLREFHWYRHDLPKVDGVLWYRDRIVIPTALR